MPRSKKLTTQTCPVPPQPVRQELLAILGAAPAPVRRAMADLLSSIKAGLAAAGETPQFADARAKVFDWRTLLPMLTDIRCKLDTPVAARLRRRGKAKAELARLEGQFALLRRAHEQMSLMVQITYALVNVGGEFQTPEEILEQSAGVLMEQLEADLFVCRLRDKSEEWVNVAADTAHGTQTPIFVHALEESIPGHPVMQAVASKQWSYVLSNNLMSAERGGDSYDCVAYQEGYRSRLAFILRGHDTRPFGLIMLYSRAEDFFSGFDHQFLADCSRIVSLTVGSRLEVGRDALAKASGGMAHVGNNALSVVKNCLELVKEDLEAAVQAGAVPVLRQFRTSLDLARAIELICCALGGAERLRGAIANLLDAVDHPRIMHYIRGEEVLDLDPRSASGEE
ncbi:MAG: histidine kinase [Humidesulfovibrio sp.]|nr:histidine kinase [Humidesulfovibrio sp.]